MKLTANAADAEGVLPWRDMYRLEMSCQIIHDSLHSRPGWTREYSALQRWPDGGNIPAARCNPRNIASRRTLQKAGFVPCGKYLNGSVSVD